MSDTNARPLPTEGPSAGGDEFDDLFNYDADVNDPFSENYVAPSAKERQREIDAAAKAKGGAGLGIDEEVEVTRKARAPRVKLDEDRSAKPDHRVQHILIESKDYSRQMESQN